MRHRRWVVVLAILPVLAVLTALILAVSPTATERADARSRGMVGYSGNPATQGGRS